MSNYLFHIDVGTFADHPGESVWGYNVKQSFEIFIEAETLSQANKVVEDRFGNYTRCRYKFVKEIT
jgi:hypothetical protein